jgi:hypothetical protein
MKAGSTLFNHFGLHLCGPYPVVHFNAFGYIHHDWRKAVAADQIGFAAKRDKPVHLRCVRINRNPRARHLPQLLYIVAWESPALDRFLFDLAAEEVYINLVN